MAKGEDHLLKKKNKSIRKRMRRAGADSLEAIQGVQAAKRRRKAGTRRACEGMCYTLPTPNDPFNERNDKKKTRKENAELRKRLVPAGEILEFETYVDNDNRSNVDASTGYEKQLKKRKVSEGVQEEGFDGAHGNPKKGRKVEDKHDGHEQSLQPSSPRAKDLQVLSLETPLHGKRLTDITGKGINKMVLAAVTEAELLKDTPSEVVLMHGNTKRRSKVEGSLLGQRCYESCCKGGDVLAASSLGWEDRALAYVVSAAAHITAQRSNHIIQHNPVMLITVATDNQSIQVRHVLKALKKALGISSVSVHTGRSLESQINGFSSQKPEIVVATPARLVELVAVQAISLSNISFLVIDGLDNILDNGFESQLLKIKEEVSPGVQKLIICNRFPKTTVNVIRQLVVDSISRVILDLPNLERSSSCITQAVSVFTLVNKRLPKLLKILQQHWEKRGKGKPWNILILVENAEVVNELIPTVQGIGYNAAGVTGPDDNQLQLVTKQLREGTSLTLVTTEQVLGQTPLHKFQLVINYSFPSTIQAYENILTGMARQSVHGILHSFCTPAMACLAHDLVQVLQSCLQEVPGALQMLADAASLVINEKQ